MGNRLRELRKERRLSLRELSNNVLIDYSALCKVENGKRNLNDNDIKVLTDFFNVSSDYLLGLSDVRENVAINNYTEHLEGIDIEILKDIKSLDDKTIEDLKTILKYLKNKGDIKK